MTHLKYERRYLHPKTKEVLKGSHFLKKGVSTIGHTQYLVDQKWVSPIYVPELREQDKERASSLKAFLLKMKANIKLKGKVSSGKGKFLIGDNEFKDKKGCYDKLQAHYDEQIERYGPICPITHMEFTFERNNKQVGRGNSILNITNLSKDRMLNEHHYTKQNLLFTSIGWNFCRGTFSIKDMSRLMRKDFFNRYMEILLERFPDKKYEFNGLGE